MTDEDTNDTVETNYNINESNDKIRVGLDITRGEGTRDQEKHKLNARGETAAEAADNMSTLLKKLEVRNVFERARKVGKESEDHDED